MIISNRSSPAEYSIVVAVAENVVDVILSPVSRFVGVGELSVVWIVVDNVDLSVLFIVVDCTNLSVVSFDLVG